MSALGGLQPNQENDSLAKQVARHQASKLRKKFMKKLAAKAAKLVKKVAIKLISMLAKVLFTLVGTIGLPEILIAAGVLILFLLMSLTWSYMTGTGQGLTGSDKSIHDYIVQQADSTVDMNSSIERPYRVPEQLLAATSQLQVFHKNDIKSVIQNMAQALAPIFDYGQYDEWTEKQVTTCTDGNCVSNPVEHTQHLVSKLNHVDYWNGSTSFTYTPHVTDWKTNTVITYQTMQVPETQMVEEQVQVPITKQVCTTQVIPGNPIIIQTGPDLYKEIPRPSSTQVICKNVTSYVTQVNKKLVTVMQDKQIEIKTITKTRNQYFTSTSNTQKDYSTFDRILNSYSLGMNDKQLIEINYLFMGGQMDYIEWLNNNGGSSAIRNVSFDGNIIPGGGVPAQFMPYYLGAQKRFGVDWNVLAAIHYVETGFSTSKTMVSSVGAIGPMQFMPATWDGWRYNTGGGLVSPSLDMSSLAVISAGNGYGIDGDGDGKADPWNNADAIYTAANYLAKNGYASDPRSAIYQYNHAEWYVDKVMSYAEQFKNAATYVANSGSVPQAVPGGFMRPANGPLSSPFGMRGNSMHFGQDIAPPPGSGTVPVVASAGGVVSKSYLSSSYGNVVFIKSNVGGQDYELVYAHLENRAVSVGQTVKQGQYLGNMGYTGDVSPPGPGGKHLHFEVHKGSWNPNKTNAINPVLVVHF